MMKKNFKFMLTALLMVAFCSATFAQNNNQGDKQQQRQRFTREQLAEKQAEHIANTMAFDDKTTEKFITTFCNQQKEIWALSPQPEKRDKNEKEQLTDEQAEQQIKARFERSQKILDIRQKYYKEYSKFLTPKQIQRAYEIEKQMMERIGNRDRGPQMRNGRRGNGGPMDNNRPDERPEMPQNENAN